MTPTMLAIAYPAPDAVKGKSALAVKKFQTLPAPISGAALRFGKNKSGNIAANKTKEPVKKTY